MSDQESLTNTEDAELADLLVEIRARLRSGETVRAEDYPRNAAAVRDLLPTVRMMTELPGAATPRAELGRLGDFRLVREVSRGGMGVVYEAVQVSLGRRVALKVLPNAAALDPRHLQRFHVEAQAAASLNHPHIVPVFATASSDGIPYYAMQFIEGRDLARVIRELRRDDLADTEDDARGPRTPTPLSTHGASFPREVARLARQAAEALDHAHANDILHRDIKPSNLIIDGDGELWVTDFGLARVLGGLDLTQTGDALGTPRYMSPEQAMGRRSPLDGRTDIYSLGVTIYELLTVRPAFPGDDRLEILRQIAHDEPPPPRKLNPKIPLDLETIVLKAMAKSPADRYTTAADLVSDLGLFLGNRSILARRPSLADQGAKWMRRHRGLVASSVGAVALIAVALVFAGWHYTALLRDHNVALTAEVERADRIAVEAKLHASEADRQSRIAETHRRLADRHYMAAQLRLAQQAAEAREFEVAQDLLDAVTPEPVAGETGEFAWHYLRRLARRELVRFPERAARLRHMSVAGDGRTIAAWYNDATIVLWDVASERPFRSIGPVKCWNLVLSPDGRILAAEEGKLGGELFEKITVWDTKSGRVLGQFAMDPAARGRPSWVHLLASGRAVASRWHESDGIQSVRIHRIEVDSSPTTETPVASVNGQTYVCILPGADFFVTLAGGRLRVRDAFTGEVRRELPGAFERAFDPAISEDGRSLAMAVAGDPVVVLDLATGAERARHDFGTEIAVVRLSPDGIVLAAVDRSGLVHVWDRQTGRSQRVKPDDLERGRLVPETVFSPDGSRIATSSSDRSGGLQPAMVWDVATGRRLACLPSPDHNAGTMRFTSDGGTLVMGGMRSPRIWHFDPPPDSPSPAGHKDEAWAAVYSPDGKILATGSDDTNEQQTIKLWHPATGELIRGWHGGEGTVSSLAFSPDGQTLASGHLANRNSVKLWDVSSGRHRHTLPGHKDMVRSVAFSPDGQTLATVGGRSFKPGEDRAIRLWDIATTRCIRELEGHSDIVRSLAFAPDGRTLATASNDQTVRRWDIETGRLIGIERSSDELAALAIAPDGATLAVASTAGVVTIHDAMSLTVLKTIRHENSEELLNLAFAPDGRSLATCGKSGTIRLWDPITGQELLSLQGHKAQVNGIAFAPDGSSLASCSHDGEVKIWRAMEGPPL
jgi:WD40 repeat protein/serine/threonine protein kinase